LADKIRADVALVQQQLCESRERAQAAIMEGRVYLADKRINKASELIGSGEALTLKTAENEYVSRGALKLEKAIRVFGANLTDQVVMDIGSSTGGFTDVCLRSGAAHVYSIDVGYGQLDWKLRNDPRVTVMERTNARYLEPGMFPERPSVTVMDVSFISIRLILPVAAGIMGDGGVFYTLIKPQFEAGREHVGKNGVVRDPETHRDVLEDIVRFTEDMGWNTVAMDFSPITGPKGNIEFLAEIRKQDGSREPFSAEKIHALVSRAHEQMAR
jgi:23S rRNA (cytidine1920-2'-O)/16S rRNA (cytidine1409-2'-O)-methyltransferase